ncbi:MAG TPA: Plug domain-containing protein [Gemmatimonadaceae bacterium]|nr:Plug domain-containing protein [Gemmatimonadaceae bacterium]
MHSRTLPWLAVLLSAALAAGCLGSSGVGGSSRSTTGTARAERPADHPIVVSEDQFRGQSIYLLRVLAARVPDMQVTPTANCPEITLRGANNIVGPSNPRIYVDGQPAANTCILDALNTEDVQRVEIYPSGMTSRSGYFNDGNGLILVFLKQGINPEL